jgi:uncharacterized integral membrane protein (TIGR00698 family)
MWIRVGIGIVNALAIIFIIFLISLWLGRKLGLSDALSILIGIGTCICGASAIAATAPAVNAKEEEIGLALACITLFSLAAMFLYPILFTSTIIGDWLGHNLNMFAIWVGTGIHETSGVTAAGGALGVACEALAVKSIRIFMIGPMVLLATYMFHKKVQKTTRVTKLKLTFPTYAVAFIVFSFFSALLDAYAPQLATAGFDWVSVRTILKGTIFKFLLALCFAGVGSNVQFKSIAKLGVKAFGVGAFLSVLAGILALVLAIVVSTLVPIYS